MDFQYKLEDVLGRLAEEYYLSEEDKQKLAGPLKSLLNTINKDMEIELARPYSHNIVGLCLAQIAQEFSVKIANSVMDAVPGIEIFYKIQKANED